MSLLAYDELIEEMDYIDESHGWCKKRDIDLVFITANVMEKGGNKTEDEKLQDKLEDGMAGNNIDIKELQARNAQLDIQVEEIAAERDRIEQLRSEGLEDADNDEDEDDDSSPTTDVASPEGQPPRRSQSGRAAALLRLR